MGGRAPTSEGVLTAPFRVLAAAQAVVLAGVGWLVLARAGLVVAGPVSDEVLAVATWVLIGLLALNTLANFAAPHPVERWGMGSITLAVVALLLIVSTRA